MYCGRYRLHDLCITVDLLADLLTVQASASNGNNHVRVSNTPPPTLHVSNYKDKMA